MKVLLTGASGFIGKQVLNELNDFEYDVYCISRKNIQHTKWFKIDILDLNSISGVLKLVKPDILIHLAWDVEHGKYWNNPINIDYKNASINLFKKFLFYGGLKIIAAGTCAEYIPSHHPIREDAIIDKNLLTPYGRAKRETFEWLDNNVDDFSWLRIFGIYGKGEDKRRFFSSAVEALFKKKDLLIHNPESFVDYVHVSHIALCIRTLIDKSVYGAINVGTGTGKSLSNIFNILSYFIQYQTYKEVDEIFSVASNSRIPDCNKILNLGFDFKWQDGLERLIKEYT